MKTVEKIFIISGLLIILLFSGAVYVNNQIDRLLENVGGLEVILTEPNATGENSITAPGAESNSNQENRPAGKDYATGKKPTPSASDLILDEGIEAIIQSKLNKPIERKDKIKVALILIKRLSVDDITYFYDLITLGNYTNEDLRHARNILSANLNNEDQETLRIIAEKYGLTP